MNESQVLADIFHVVGARPDVRLWRQSTGAGVLVQPKQLAGALAKATGIPAPVFVRLINQNGRYQSFGMVGQSDFSGVLRGGRALFLEAKSDDGEQSDGQRAFQAIVERFGALYLLARSAADATEQLTDAGYPPP